MTIQVEFLVLPPNCLQNQGYLFACRWVEKAYLADESVYIHTNNAEEAARINQLLWTFRDESFIPHEILKNSASAPILIGHQHAPPHDILLNLSQHLPDFHPQFPRIVEIVFPDPVMQQCAREHFRQYKNSGYEITTRKLQVTELTDYGKNL